MPKEGLKDAAPQPSALNHNQSVQKAIQELMDQVDLDCPVCLEIPRNVHALQCSNGHMICETCFKRLMRRGPEENKRCPNCREKYKKELPRCLVVEKLIAAANIPDEI